MEDLAVPTTCPKCGFRLLAPAEACPKCGVVFARLAGPRHAVRPRDVVVTTGDLHCEYDVLGPVYCQVSNKGLFSNQLDQLADKYGIPRSSTEAAPGTLVFAIFLDEWPVGQQNFQRAFLVCVEELKRQTIKLGGDAIVWLRQDIDLDTSGFQFFYMQAYATAVRRRG